MEQLLYLLTEQESTPAPQKAPERKPLTAAELLRSEHTLAAQELTAPQAEDDSAMVGEGSTD